MHDQWLVIPISKCHHFRCLIPLKESCLSLHVIRIIIIIMSLKERLFSSLHSNCPVLLLLQWGACSTSLSEPVNVEKVDTMYASFWIRSIHFITIFILLHLSVDKRNLYLASTLSNVYCNGVSIPFLSMNLATLTPANLLKL